MKLSICIPVYNFDIRQLVSDLMEEISKNGLNAEILLIDDASEKSFVETNREVQNKVKNFVFLKKNIGRSQIRNLFLYYAKGDFLLFLDGDGKIIHPNFLKKYCNYVHQNPSTKIVYGGRKVSDKQPDPMHILRWRYALERENLSCEARQKKPYLGFQTNNFLVKKETLEKINFNPQFQKYGYEDLLFAKDLKHDGIKINHISNPILNNDIETNEEYLRKVEESVISLYTMMQNKEIYPKITEIKLVKAHNYIQKSGLQSWFAKLFESRAQKTKEKLLKGNSKMILLDFYKLGLLLNKFNS